MNYRKMAVLIGLLNDYIYFQDVYDYRIISVTADETKIIATICELTPIGEREAPYHLIVELKKGKLSFRNTNNDDCIYDFLDENDITKEQADNFMDECYEAIADTLGI